MFETDHQAFFESVLFNSLGYDLPVTDFQFVSGGNINNTVKVNTKHGSFFLKWNEDPEVGDLFEKELLGLNELKRSPIDTPEAIATGRFENKSYLLMEWIESAAPSSDFWEKFGTQLAQQHQLTQPQYGLDHNNHIGKLPQKNEWKKDWIDFLIEHRLEVQLGLAIYNNLIDGNYADKFRKIYPLLPELLPQEPASLLHGDLWSGNFMRNSKGQPVIFDPAVNYGNREIELAFTHLFGGFDVSFYHTYDNVYSLEPGFLDRVDIYNLYPLLVHVNLFGRSYLSGINQTLRRFT